MKNDTRSCKKGIATCDEKIKLDSVFKKTMKFV